MFPLKKPFFESDEDGRKRSCGQHRSHRSNDGDSIVPAIFDFLYREYCRARLAEMRKELFLLPKKAETIADVDCAERDSSSDDKAAGQHEARDH